MKIEVERHEDNHNNTIAPPALASHDSPNPTGSNNKLISQRVIVIKSYLMFMVAALVSGTLSLFFPQSTELLYFFQLPWVTLNLEILLFLSSLYFLRHTIGPYSFKFMLLNVFIRIALCFVINSALIFGLTEVIGYRPVILLFLAFSLDVVTVTLIPLTMQKPSFKHFLAFLILLLPLFQLYTSMLFGHFIMEYELHVEAKRWICYVYPILIGAFKMLMQKLNKENFEADDLVDILSFGLADLPYRMLYFELDGWSDALILMTVKFTYKLYGYWLHVFFRNFFAFISIKARLKRKQEGNADVKYYVIPGDVYVYKDPEFIEEMSSKFFMQQFIDTFDIVSVSLIVLFSRVTERGIAADFSDQVFEKIMSEGALELAIELVFTILTYIIIRAKFSDFRPMEKGAEFLKAHKLTILMEMAMVYPTIFLIMREFKADLAVVFTDAMNQQL